MLNDIPGLSCIKPRSFLCLPKVDVKRFNIKDDMQFIKDLLSEKGCLVQGTASTSPTRIISAWSSFPKEELKAIKYRPFLSGIQTDGLKIGYKAQPFMQKRST